MVQIYYIEQIKLVSVNQKISKHIFFFQIAKNDHFDNCIASGCKNSFGNKHSSTIKYRSEKNLKKNIDDFEFACGNQWQFPKFHFFQSFWGHSALKVEK